MRFAQPVCLRAIGGNPILPSPRKTWNKSSRVQRACTANVVSPKHCDPPLVCEFSREHCLELCDRASFEEREHRVEEWLNASVIPCDAQQQVVIFCIAHRENRSKLPHFPDNPTPFVESKNRRPVCNNSFALSRVLTHPNRHEHIEPRC